MPGLTDHELVRSGRTSLACGDVDAAIRALSIAAETDRVPDAHELLAGLAYATEDLSAVRHHWEEAFLGYREAGDLRGAGRCATSLGHFHFSVLGREAVAAGWLGRARRLLAQVGRCVEQGYLELAIIACDVRDAVALEHSAQIALELAEEFDDPDLHARALADGGLALVSQGRIAEGFACLDEAMVPVSTGELHDPVTKGKIFCAMLTACDRARDMRRVQQWTELCDELVLRHLDGRLPVLHSHCRIVYGAALCTVGRWPEAETELLHAVGGTKVMSHRAKATARLAELRLMQGRLVEAAELLAPIEDQFEAAETLSRLHLANNRLDLAASVVRRHLDELATDRLRSGRLLALLVDIELARGDVAEAHDVSLRLEGCVADVQCPVLLAEAELALARVAAAGGHIDEAGSHLNAAQRHIVHDERPILLATIRLERAKVLAADRPAAISEARAALALFERLAADREADRARAVLRGMGAPVRFRPSDRTMALGELSTREHEVLDLLAQGLTNAEIATRLYISAKTAEHHVGRVLAKLGVRSRTEAVAFAAAEALARP